MFSTKELESLFSSNEFYDSIIRFLLTIDPLKRENIVLSSILFGFQNLNLWTDAECLEVYNKNEKTIQNVCRQAVLEQTNNADETAIILGNTFKLDKHISGAIRKKAALSDAEKIAVTKIAVLEILRSISMQFNIKFNINYLQGGLK